MSMDKGQCCSGVPFHDKLDRGWGGGSGGGGRGVIHRAMVLAGEYEERKKEKKIMYVKLYISC